MHHLAGALLISVFAMPYSPRDLEQSLAVLDHLDEMLISVDYLEEPLIAVVDDLSSQAPIPLRADWPALERLFVGERDEITLRLESVPFSTALAALTMTLGDEFERPTYEVGTGQILLTTYSATEAMRVTDVYDVRDLLADAGTLPKLRAEAPPPPVVEKPQRKPADPESPPASLSQNPIPALTSGGNESDSQNATPEPLPPEPLTEGKELMYLIADHVDPDAWHELGGSRAHISERDGVIFVTAAPTTHRKFRDALARLRRAIPSAMTIEASIVDLPRSDFESLTRRHSLTSAALVRAITAVAGESRLWETTSAVAIDQDLTVKSQAAGIEIEINLTPHIDRDKGILSIDIHAGSIHGDDRRSVRTTVTVPAKRGGAVIELPAAEVGESMRLLVLIPSRI